MATKKKVTPKKKAAPKKKTSPKKKAVKKQITPTSQEIIEREPIEMEEDRLQQEESEPTLPPVYTPSPTPTAEADSEEEGNPLFKYLIIAALALVGIIAFSVIMKKGNDPTPTDKIEQKDESGKEEDSSQKEDSKVDDSAKISEKKETETTTEKAPEPSTDKLPSGLKGFAIAQMVSGKTYTEAVEHCKSINMSLPKADQLRAIQKEDIPNELSSSVVWTKEKLRFLFSVGKAYNIKSGDKFQVLCKE